MLFFFSYKSIKVYNLSFDQSTRFISLVMVGVHGCGDVLPSFFFRCWVKQNWSLVSVGNGLLKCMSQLIRKERRSNQFGRRLFTVTSDSVHTTLLIFNYNKLNIVINYVNWVRGKRYRSCVVSFRCYIIDDCFFNYNSKVHLQHPWDFIPSADENYWMWTWLVRHVPVLPMYQTRYSHGVIILMYFYIRELTFYRWDWRFVFIIIIKCK